MRRLRFWGVLLTLMLAVPFLMAQVNTYRIERLGGGSSGKLAEVDSSGNLMVSTSGTVAAATDPGYQSFPKVRLAGGATGNLAEVDSNGNLLVSIGSGNYWTAAQGGTGLTSYTIGDLLYASTTTALSKLADVTAGSYLRSGGANTAPVWSTTTLPNSATTGDLLAASAANGYANVTAVAAGQVLASAGTGTLPAWSGQPTLTAGSGTQTYKMGGTLYWENGVVGTAGDALYVTSTPYALPAATLATNGDQLVVDASFLFDATAGTKTITCSLGYSSFDTTTGFTGGLSCTNQGTTLVSQSAHAHCAWTRLGAASSSRAGHIQFSATMVNTGYATSSAVTHANQNNVACICKSTGAVSNSCIIEEVRLTWNPR